MMIRILTLVALLVSMALGVMAQGAPEKPKHSELYYQRASLFDVLGVDSTTIVFLGNSLTHGCEWHELLRDHRVVNRGINGDIIQGMEERLACVVNGHPAKIFLLAGANDVSHNLTPDSIATATEALVRHIRQATPQTQVYVQSLLPVNNADFSRYKTMREKEQVILDINALVQPRIEALGATWINLHPLFCDENGNMRREYTNDGLHLLGPAYLVWRDALLPYLNE